MKLLISAEDKLLLRLFWLTILISFLAWIFNLIINPQGSQLNLFFDRMNNFWADATNVTGMIIDMNPYYGEAKGSYPPLAYMLFYPLMRVSSVPVFTYSYDAKYFLYYYQPIWTMLFVVFISISLLVFFTICVDQLDNYPSIDVMLTSITLCLSYPMLYTLERGNVLIVSVVAISFFIFHYDSACRWKKEMALLSLAIASGIKVSPAIFGILLIKNKDWIAMLRAICYGLLFLIMPFFFFDGGLNNLQQMFYNINYFLVEHEGASNALGTSLFTSFLKYSVFFFGEDYFNLDTYYVLSILNNVLKYEISLLLFITVFCFKEKWKMVLNITLILLILPKVSYPYNVFYLFPFTVLFLNTFSSSSNVKITIDIFLIYISLIMIYFVYRCPVSNFFNYNFAIPVLTIIAVIYSVHSLIHFKHISNC